MSRYWISLRVLGPIDVLDDLSILLKDLSPRLLRMGERYHKYGPVQPANVFTITLAKWERPGIYSGDDREVLLAEEMQHLQTTTTTLRRIAPILAPLDPSQTEASLWISTIREEDQGGFGLPAELVAAVAASGLGIDVSIQVAFDSENVDAESQPS